MARKRRFFWHLYPSCLIITLVPLLAVAWYASHELRKSFLNQTAADLLSQARLVGERIREYMDPVDPTAIDGLCKRMGRAASTRITVVLAGGKVIGDSEEDPSAMDNHQDRPEFRNALAGETGISKRHSRTQRMDMMYVAIPVMRGAEVLGAVRTSVSLTSLADVMQTTRSRIALAGLAVALLAALLSFVVSRRVTRPIREIRLGAERFARGELEGRLPMFDSEEIAGLADTMNQMAAELKDRIDMMSRQRNEIEAVLSSMAEGVLAVDMEGRVIRMNGAASRMFGCNASGAGGRSIQEIVRNIDFQKFVSETLAGHEPARKDVVLYSGEEQRLEAHGTPLSDAEGKRMGALIVLNDVTRLRRLENVRRDFVANVSHEIKTPITAIKGFVETLRHGSVEAREDAERFLGIIARHVNRLEALIVDLLSLSRIEQEAEQGEIRLTEGRLRHLLETAVQICEPKAAAKQIEVKIECVEGLTARIDATLMEQAVVNLVDNAVKYSGEKTTVSLGAEDTHEGIVIRVSDQGRGIEKRHLPRLFERFYRVDTGRSRDLGGTGLGLAIVKHIVQAHGGRVSVESRVGKGSTFTIHLPKTQEAGGRWPALQLPER